MLKLCIHGCVCVCGCVCGWLYNVRCARLSSCDTLEELLRDKGLMTIYQFRCRYITVSLYTGFTLYLDRYSLLL